jgi:thiamine-monophosphate kinase
VALALALNRALRPHALIDISDGLAPDLRHVLDAAGCGAVLDATLVDAALHTDAHRLAAQDGRPAREHGLYDGEDFELIVVLGPDAAARAAEFPELRPLGQIVAGAELELRDADGALHAVPRGGWEHFR